eukprot:gb/GECH01013133.1/.p1 GENE.gb/GECH01013133.1/~~gb/GECH01013133.1/.p1  ORF type:complete len:312 (+),score=56.27 gb/GECH01013133.1/:1-936(+)
MKPNNSVDLYTILDVSPSTEGPTLLNAYKRLALKYHPDKDQENPKESYRRFKEVSKAYRVLRDDNLRSIYNREGISGLHTKGLLPKPNPEELWKEVTGTLYPFADIFSNKNHSSTKSTSSPQNEEPEQQDTNSNTPILPDTLEELWCSLEEMYYGCTKRMEVIKYHDNEEETRQTVRVDIQPGWEEGTRLRYRGDGNSREGHQPGDRVILIMQKPHDRFTRCKADLYTTVEVSLLEALTGTTIQIETLDGRNLKIPVNDVVHPGYKRTLKGEGMPHLRGPGRGDLVVMFKVQFPQEVTREQREGLKRIFGN